MESDSSDKSMSEGSTKTVRALASEDKIAEFCRRWHLVECVLVITAFLCAGWVQTAQLHYCFEEGKALHYELEAQASLVSVTEIAVRGHLTFRCFKHEGDRFVLEGSLRDLVVTRNGKKIGHGAAHGTQATVRFEISQRGEIAVREPASDTQPQNPAKMVLEALIDSLPRLPAGPVCQNDSWTAQSEEAAAPFIVEHGGQMLVRYKCSVEEIPILFGGPVVGLSSSFESEAGSGASGPGVSGRGKGRVVFCSDGCTIKSLVHETLARVTSPEHHEGSRRATYRMRLSVKLVK
jgi:hypothetical protein